MATQTSPILSLISHFIVLAIISSLTFTSLTHSATFESDSQALQALKNAVDPNSIPRSSYLNTWNFSLDPCESSGGSFLGIICSAPLDNSSNRVLEIILDAVGYEGFISPSIANLTELRTLDLSKNKFRGPIPDNIGNLKKLTRFVLSDNFLTGSIPEGIHDLKILEFLDLGKNSLSGTIPPNITALRSLSFLSLSRNSMIGKVPDLSGLWQLNTLDLSSNQFEGILPDFPVTLRSLSLRKNIMSGHLTPLTKLRHLTRLDVSDNRLSGPIRKGFLSLPMAVYVNVSFNRFTSIEVASYVGVDTKLRVLDAQSNHLTGRLPINLVTIPTLIEVNLANNNFLGPIPREYGIRVQRSWRRLYLDHNFLSGNPPAELLAYAARIRGNLSKNCLRCPANFVLCRGGQRPASQCIGESNNGQSKHIIKVH